MARSEKSGCDGAQQVGRPLALAGCHGSAELLFETCDKVGLAHGPPGKRPTLQRTNVNQFFGFGEETSPAFGSARATRFA